MHKRVLQLAIGVFVFAAASDAAAQVGQPWTDRGYANFSLGFESVSGQFNDATTRTIYGEAASLSVSQAIDSGSFIDLSGGARVWQNVSVGVAFHQGSTHSEASLAGSIPHPLFVNRPRPLAVSVTDLKRTERAFHVQIGYMLSLTDRVSVHVLGGPSFYHLGQDVVSDITLNESANFATVGATGTVTERDDSPLGFNIGADVAYTFYQGDTAKVGAGMFVRYSGASADVLVLQSTVDSDVGGLQVGFGVRTRF
jgi:hypothetical protein